MKRNVATLFVLLLMSAPAFAQRATIETNETHNVSHAEWRIKGSPIASMEVAGVKIAYPQIAVNPIPGFTSVGGNIKTELAEGEIRVGLAGVLKKIGTFETTKTMRVLDVNHKPQTITPDKYDLGFEYQPEQKLWALQLSKADQVAANVPLFMKEGSTPVETLSMTLTTMPGKTIEVKKREEYRYEASGIRVNVRWGDLDATTMIIGFAEEE
jgi:hypothetical protein